MATMVKDQSRRNFLRTAPAVTVAGLSLSELLLNSPMLAEPAGGGTTPPDELPPMLFTASQLAGIVQALGGAPGNNDIVKVNNLPVTIAMTSEKAKAGKEFEYHEHRDHIFQILEGETTYQLGGTPQNARNTGPGEWLAPASEGARTYELKKGDMIIVPRGTPHKRTTKGSVTFMLISGNSPTP